MKEIIMKVYKFEELNEEAKEKAREWYREGIDNTYPWEYINDDAKTIGLIINSLDQHRQNEGHFEHSAEDTAKRIIDQHGEHCSTSKTAKEYLAVIKSLIPDEEGYLSLYDQDKEKQAEADFLHSLLEEYMIMLDNEIDYQYSDEAVDENIRINEYEFTKNGKRFCY